MNLWLSFSKAITLFPHQEALVDGNKRFTYLEFGHRVANLAQSMATMGIKRGSTAAIISCNCHEFMETYYACAISGIILTPVNYRLSVQEMVFVVQDCQATTLIVHANYARQAQVVREACPRIKRVIWIGDETSPDGQSASFCFEDLSGHGDGTLPHLPNLGASDLAYLFYTSGTTGRPKGVMLAQGDVAFNALGVIAELGLTEADVWLHAAPIFHLADAPSVFAMTWVGGKHVFLPAFDPADALAAIHSEGVTITILVPTMLNTMLNYPRIEQFNKSSLRAMITAGSPIAPETVRRATRTFGCEYMQLYGMTETGPWLTLSKPKPHQMSLPEEQQLAIRSRTGRPCIGVEIKVVRPDGSEVEQNNREVGEVIARGPAIVKRYWRQPEATAETTRDGWILTGDLAVIDQEGYIDIVDRKKDMIITGGENVYSVEVEHALYEHPDVAECAVFGIPDPHWGEAVKAAVVCKAGCSLTERELIAFAKQRLSSYKVPKSIDFMSELPKTGSGKICKRGLKEPHWVNQEKQVS